MEEWHDIQGFPNYAVSTHGRVRNNRTGRIMALSRNQQGIVKVGLSLNGKLYVRSVAVIVASTFLTPHEFDNFNTPIHLDGDKTNNHVENLMWRPRWFAAMYHHQFKVPTYRVSQPIYDMDTNETFLSSKEAAMKYGLLERDIFVSCVNKSHTPITYQYYRFVEE